MKQKREFYISNVNFVYGSIENAQIDLSFIPAMSRRKLSLVDKAAMSVMNKAYTGNQTEIVFASQYGELDRLNKIISQYQQENEVSPFAFSTSVHNSVSGQFSLLHGIKKSYNALAADKNTLSIGLLDSIMSIKKDNDILFCYADAYKEIKACAMVISESPKNDSSLFELSTQPAKPIETNDEFTIFKDFIEKKQQSFCAIDGLFSITRKELKK